jgi:hypothetical protein
MTTYLQALDTMETRTNEYEKELMLRLESILKLLNIKDNKKYEERGDGKLSRRGFHDCVLSRLSLIETAIQWTIDDGK